MATRRSDVKRLPLHNVSGDDDLIDCLTLAAMCRDGVAVRELAHALLLGMVKRRRGHIVNLGSVAAEFPYPGGNVYGATRAFVQQFSFNIRADLVGNTDSRDRY